MIFVVGITNATATVTNISASEDTFSYIFEPDTNYGSDISQPYAGFPYPVVGVWNYYNRQSKFVYIKFANISGTGSPNIPSNSIINSATMWLYTRAGSSQIITFYTPSDPWDESVLTWNNQPSRVTPYAVVAQDGSTAHWTSVDVTNIVRKWNDGTVPNEGLVAASDGGGASASTDWASKESPSNNPYILVDYIPPDTIPPVITINGSVITNVEVNKPYIDLGATAIDNVDGVIVPLVFSTVDTTKIGTYTVSYIAIDSSKNIANTVRIVTVVKKIHKNNQN